MDSHATKRSPHAGLDYAELAGLIKQWSSELGFEQAGITDTDLGRAEQRLQRWVADGRHGDMAWMTSHGTKRSRPAELVPGTRRVICVRMRYWPQSVMAPQRALEASSTAYVSRYALGRDYHKVMRRRLQRLADRIQERIGPFGYRAFTDSAPVMEKPLAQKAGLGWIGKHTNLLNKSDGSWFFLGELFTDLPLPVDPPASDHCGTCRSCIDACPTGAITAPYQLDARLCISYLTIEQRGAIPEQLRPYLGNRVFGCDDCQAVCPWNRYAAFSDEADFTPRSAVSDRQLAWFASWSEAEFDRYTAGSAIRRAGYAGFLRNVAVALGNAGSTREVLAAIDGLCGHASELVREHAQWARRRHRQPA